MSTKRYANSISINNAALCWFEQNYARILWVGYHCWVLWMKKKTWLEEKFQSKPSFQMKISHILVVDILHFFIGKKSLCEFSLKIINTRENPNAQGMLIDVLTYYSPTKSSHRQQYLNSSSLLVCSSRAAQGSCVWNDTLSTTKTIRLR